MRHAELCPVCSGSGKYKKKKCHGCGGKGWIEVGRDMDFSIPPYPRPWPNPYDSPYDPRPKPIWIRG